MNSTIDDAIYNASPDIIKHRYNPLIGIILTVVSIFLLWANSNVAWFDTHEMLSQWNLLLSSCVLCTGLTMICYRCFGDSAAPVDKQCRERLYRSEYSFDANELPKVKAAVEEGNFALLKNLPRSYQSSAQVICYRTDSGSIIVAQVLKLRQPDSDIVVFHQGNYTF